MEFPFNVVDHAAARKRQQLTRDMLAFAAAGGTADEHIAKLGAFRGSLHPQDVLTEIFGQEEMHSIQGR
jgi:hypothetical protein